VYRTLRAGCPSIREKALSRHKTPLPRFSHRVTARVVEDRSSGTLTVNPFSVKQIVPPAIDTGEWRRDFNELLVTRIETQK
jgi:hypothetical protein